MARIGPSDNQGKFSEHAAIVMASRATAAASDRGPERIRAPEIFDVLVTPSP